MNQSNNSNQIKIAVHHPGAAMRYATPLALQDAGLLYKMFTDFYGYSTYRELTGALDLLTFSQVNAKVKISRRYNSQLPEALVEHLGLEGLFYHLLRLKNPDPINSLEVGFKIGDAIARKMQKHTNYFDYIYCLALNAVSCRHFMPNKPIVLEEMHIPIASLLPVIERESSKNSDWLPDSMNLYKDYLEFIREKEILDLKSANFVVAPSEFVRNKLLEDLNQNAEKVSVVPYAAPAWLYSYENSLTLDTEVPPYNRDFDKLKILFVGEVGIRKGIPYLLEALEKIEGEKFEMRAVGSIRISSSKMQHYSNICSFLGRLDKDELVSQYKWANLFVFPSLGEGSAGVINEAMAFGLPIITTKSSGSYVRDGLEGYLVPEGDLDSLIDRINEYSNDPSKLHNHSVNAWTRARDFTIQKTTERLQNYFMQLQ